MPSNLGFDANSCELFFFEYWMFCYSFKSYWSLFWDAIKLPIKIYSPLVLLCWLLRRAQAHCKVRHFPITEQDLPKKPTQYPELSIFPAGLVRKDTASGPVWAPSPFLLILSNRSFPASGNVLTWISWSALSWKSQKFSLQISRAHSLLWTSLLSGTLSSEI